MRIALILTFTALPVWADSPMTAAEFDAYATGKTLSFGTEGTPSYGVEQYLPGKRVIWSGAPGECTTGVWYESKGSICFRYDSDPEPKCWAIYAEPDGLRAVFTTRPGTTVIFESIKEQLPLICNDLSS